MSRTDPIATRDKERTRRAILEAAERLFSERGAGVSLADIAEGAGVAKGGLMHHFPSRDALIYGVMEHCAVRMWEEVRAHIDLGEVRAGQFTRGYVRALTGDSDYLSSVYSPTGLIAVFGNAAEVQDIFERDAALWNAAFAADGLSTERVLVIRYAAEGLALAAGSPYVTPAALTLGRSALLALAEPLETPA